MKGKRVKWFSAVLGVMLILGVIAAGCAPSEPEKPKKESIKAGFSAPISGWASVAVETVMNPYIMWSEKVNAEGGIYVKDLDQRLPIELVYYDDKSSADEVIKVYERLITVDKVDILLPPWGTWATFPLLPLVEKYKVPLISGPSGAQQILGVEANYLWVFGETLGFITGPALANLLGAHKDQIGTRIAYIGAIYSAILDLKAAFIPAAEAQGFEIVLEKDYPLDVTDLSEVLLEIKGLNPDILIAGTVTADMILIIRQSMEIGLSPKVLYFWVGPGVVEFHDIFGDAGEGIMGLAWWDRYGPGPGATEFYDAYVERWGEKPDMTDVSLSWQAAQIMEQAIEKAGTLDWETLNNVIATEEFTTIIGPVQFSTDQVAYTGINRTGGVGQIQGAEVRLIWPPEYASSEFQYPKPPWPK